jgi:hypothetical protein
VQHLYRNRPFPIRPVHLYRKVGYLILDGIALPMQNYDTKWGGQSVNELFAHHTDRMPLLYKQLMRGDELPLAPQAAWRKLGAIYVFFHNGKAEHVGRTRNLQSRIRGHLSDSHYSASFAFRQTRRELSLVATYAPEGARAALFAREDFRAAFRGQSLRLRGMTMRFLAVDCPIDQYLLELYTAMELTLSLDEFDTH